METTPSRAESKAGVATRGGLRLEPTNQRVPPDGPPWPPAYQLTPKDCHPPEKDCTRTGKEGTLAAADYPLF